MKKSLLLVLLLFSGLLFIGCTNVRKPQDFNVLSINDIKDKTTTISFKVRAGVVSTALEGLVEEFENEFPYIKVDIKTVSGNYDLLRSTTVLDINSKNNENIPDLIMGYPDHFAEYYGGSNLVNLQYFIDDKEVGFTKEEMEDFIPGYLPENRGFDSAFPNDLFGLPFNKSTEVMVYNKTAFEVLFGENYLDKVPTTWDEVKTVGKEIVEKVKKGELDKTFVDTYDPETDTTTHLKVSDYLSDPENVKFLPFGYDSSDNAFITFTRQWGGKYTERESIFKGHIYFDNAESKAAMEYFQNMNKEGLFGTAASFGAQYNSDALKLIQVLMTVGSSAGVGYNASDKYEYELGFAPIPYKDADKKYVIQQGTNIGMFTHNTDEEKLAAWLFVKFLMRPENTAAFAMATGGYLPVKKSAYETEEYSEYLTNPTDDKKEFSAAANVALYDYIEKEYLFFVDDAFIGSSDIRNEGGSIFDAVIVNGANIANRYKEAYNKLNSYVKKDN